MLVLSRKAGESIQIGREIVVRVLSVSGNKVSLGIDAPDGCRIFRTEILEPNHASTATGTGHGSTNKTGQRDHSTKNPVRRIPPVLSNVERDRICVQSHILSRDLQPASAR